MRCDKTCRRRKLCSERRSSTRRRWRRKRFAIKIHLPQYDKCQQRNQSEKQILIMNENARRAKRPEQSSNAADATDRRTDKTNRRGRRRTRGEVIVNDGTLHKFWQRAVTVMIAKVNDNNNVADVRPPLPALRHAPRQEHVGSKALAGNRSSPKVNTEDLHRRPQQRAQTRPLPLSPSLSGKQTNKPAPPAACHPLSPT